jgi:hypothetical protein
LSRRAMLHFPVQGLVYPDPIPIKGLISWCRVTDDIKSRLAGRPIYDHFLGRALAHPHPVVRSTVERMLGEQRPMCEDAITVFGAVITFPLEVFVAHLQSQTAFQIRHEVLLTASGIGDPVLMAVCGSFLIVAHAFPSNALEASLAGCPLFLDKTATDRLMKATKVATASANATVELTQTRHNTIC